MSDRITNNAFAKARVVVRNKIVEHIGESSTVDVILEKKKDLIRSVASRIIQRDKTRLASFATGKKLKNLGQPEGMNETIVNQLFVEYFPQYDVSNAVGQKVDVPVASQRPSGDGDKKSKATIIQYNSFGNEKIANSDTYKAIAKKSSKNKISEQVLGEVYDRGLALWNDDRSVTREQYAFARVNSYISGGKAFEEDSDLHDHITELSISKVSNWLKATDYDTGKRSSDPARAKTRDTARGKIGATDKPTKVLATENTQSNNSSAYEPKGRGFTGDRYELRKNDGYHSIIKTHQLGKSLQNKWGGYPSIHTGNPKYINRKWNALKTYYDSPNVSRSGFKEEVFVEREGVYRNNIPRDQINSVEKTCSPTDTKSAHYRQGQIQRKIIDEMEIDPSKREIGTNSLTKTYKTDTPCTSCGKVTCNCNKHVDAKFSNQFKEEVKSALKEPIVVPPIRREDGTYSPARTVMRKTQKKIIRSGNVYDGDQSSTDDYGV